MTPVARPRLTDRVLDLLGDRGRFFDSLLHNTAAPTRVAGGHTHNVIPSEVSVDLDCRLLPRVTREQVFEELRALAGVPIEFDVLRYDAGPSTADLTLFDTSERSSANSTRVRGPFPSFVARLGIQTYGFLPMQLPAEMRFMELGHAEDERIPVDALEFGTTAIHGLLDRFGSG